jgi:hypothetical protein
MKKGSQGPRRIEEKTRPEEPSRPTKLVCHRVEKKGKKEDEFYRFKHPDYSGMVYAPKSLFPEVPETFELYDTQGFALPNQTRTASRPVSEKQVQEANLAAQKANERALKAQLKASLLQERRKRFIPEAEKEAEEAGKTEETETKEK